VAIVEVLRTAVLLVLGLAVATHSLSLVLIYGAAATLGSLEALFSAASHAALPGLVKNEELPRANGYLQSAQIAGSQFAGPALGGLLFTIAATLPFVIDGVSFLASAALLALALPRTHRRPLPPVKPVTTVSADVMAGVSWFRANPLLRVLALTVGGLSFCWAMVTAVTVLYALEVLHLSGAGYGLFLSVGAAGEVAGGILASALLRRFGTAPIVIVGALAATVAYLTIGMTSALVVATVAVVAETFGIGVANVATMSLRQALVPPELLGRVGSVFRMCVFGAMPVGALAGGALAHGGLRLPFLCAAAIQAVLLASYGPTLVRRINDAERELGLVRGLEPDVVDLTDTDREPVLQLV
jgi:MFS family permease